MRIWWRDLEIGRRILVCAAVFGAILGITDLGAPLESWLLGLRNSAVERRASGNFVVVAIDDKSIQEIGQWPWPRRYHAQLVDKLLDAGAERVALGIAFRAASQPADDEALASAMREAKGKAAFGALRFPDTVAGSSVEVLPAPSLGVAPVVSLTLTTNFLGQPDYVEPTDLIQGNYYPHVSSWLAGSRPVAEQRVRPDYGIRADTIPRISAADVLRGRVRPTDLRGKKVIIAQTTPMLADMMPVPGQRRLASAFVHVLASEAVERGGSRYLGFFPGLLVTLLIAHFALRPSRRINHALTAAAVPLTLLTVAAFLESRLIFITVVPALSALATILIAARWTSIKRQAHADARVNLISGLPNLGAMREAQVPDDAALVAARVVGFATMIASLSKDEEAAMVHQLAGRLAVGGSHQLFQGDDGQFAWFVPQEDLGGIGGQLESLHLLFRSPVRIGNRSLDVQIAFGISAGDGRSVHARLASALGVADEAAAEGLRWKAYDPARLADAEWRLSLLGQLDQAISNGEIWVAYQPKLNLKSGQIDGAEALVRWSHPNKGTIAPDEFVQAAEQHGRIDLLTSFVLNDAISRAKEQHDAGREFNVAVNVSARLLETDWLVAHVTDLLRRHTLPAKLLTLELTESATLRTDIHSQQALASLIALGVTLSLDDYGTGHSTLEYMSALPAGEIKVDRRFVARLQESRNDRVVIESTIDLAHTLNRRVVAEGVEDEETLRTLRELNCDYAQGFYIGRPMSWHDLKRFVPKRKLAPPR